MVLKLMFLKHFIQKIFDYAKPSQLFNIMIMVKKRMKEIFLITIIMAQVFIIILMAMHTMVNGKMEKDMAKVYIIMIKTYSQMVPGKMIIKLIITI